MLWNYAIIKAEGDAMKGNIYLSYSGRNCEAVLQVMEHLYAGGIGFVCDCMLPAHTSFEERASRAVAQAELVAAVITEDAAECSYMDAELEYAFAQGKRVLPIVVGAAQVPVNHAARLQGSVHVSEFPTKAEMAAVMGAILSFDNL